METPWESLICQNSTGTTDLENIKTIALIDWHGFMMLCPNELVALYTLMLVQSPYERRMLCRKNLCFNKNGMPTKIHTYETYEGRNIKNQTTTIASSEEILGAYIETLKGCQGCLLRCVVL